MLDLTTFWTVQEVANIITFRNLIKHRLKYQYIQHILILQINTVHTFFINEILTRKIFMLYVTYGPKITLPI